MKQKTLQSGFLGALSGEVGAFMACALGLFVPLFMHLLFSAPTGNDGLLIIDFIFDDDVFSYIWLPSLIAGSLVGFFSGGWVTLQPQFLSRSYVWALIGGLTSACTFIFVGNFGYAVFTPFVVMAAICGMAGGLVARYVYGMLQRRFLPELQMN